MKLYLLRHGERGNGIEQDTLTKLGIEQSKISGKYFETIEIDRIISGTLERIKNTTQEIINYVNCSVEYSDLLNEQSLGVLQGKSASAYKEALAKSCLSKDEFRSEKGENSYDAYNRAVKFVDNLKNCNSSILVVSSSGVISNIVTILLSMPMEKNINFKVNFCSISYFEVDKGIVKDFYIDNITHLAKLSLNFKK